MASIGALKMDNNLYANLKELTPRYNIFPIPSHWKEKVSDQDWLSSCEEALNLPQRKVSLYLHIPFCESLCSFCACNTFITTDHTFEKEYVKEIIDEFQLYALNLPNLKKSSLQQLYIGGGTPNFLSIENLSYIMESITPYFSHEDNPEFTIELDPRHLTKDYLKSLYKLGFQNISLGIESLNPDTQRIINRVQSESLIKKVCDDIKEIGFSRLHFNLIYGLPKQSQRSIEKTLETILNYKAERISYYSYIHISNTNLRYRLYGKDDLPKAKEKISFFQYIQNTLKNEGYIYLGLDHYVLSSDPLALSQKAKTLSINPTGYTYHKADLLLSLGTSAISKSKNIYHQNEIILNKYKKNIRNKKINSYKSYQLNAKDLIYSKIIYDLCCFGEAEIETKIWEINKKKLSDFEEQGFLYYNSETLVVKEEARPLLRNICYRIDPYRE